MRRANQFLVLGIVGLLASLTNYFFISEIDDLTPYVTPWLVFFIIGLSMRLKYVKK